MDEILFTAKKIEAFRLAYLTAVKEGKAAFVFEDRDFVTNYAKYVLEYLDDQMKGGKK